MKKHKIKIEVSGLVGTGKSIVASVIYKALVKYNCSVT